jgi:hypothetical protein
MTNSERVLANSKEHQAAIASNSEQSKTETKNPDQTTGVRVLLYCFKPPFPSGGGSAAASAGRVEKSTFTVGNLAHVVRFEQGRFKAHPGRPKDGRPTPL